MSEKVFTRRVSLPDLVYAATGYRHWDQNQLVSQVVVEGSGIITEQELRDAVAEVAIASPACRARLRGFWRFKSWSADGPLPGVRVVQQEWDGQFRSGLSYIDTPLDLVSGPSVEIVLVVGSRTFVVFRVHHALMDGIGMMDFMNNIFRALRGEPAQEFQSRVTVEKLPEGNLRAIPPAIRNPALPLQLHSAGPGEVDRSRMLCRLTLPGKDSRILLKAILALGHLAQENGVGPVRVQVPVNLRRHLPGKNSSANLVGMIRLDIAEGDTLRSLVRQFSEKMELQQEIPIAVKSLSSRAVFWIPLFLLRAFERKAMASFFRKPVYKISGTVSSLGSVTIAGCSTERFHAEHVFGIPVHPLGSPLFAVIVSGEDSNEMVISAASALVTESELKLFAERLKNQLSQIR